MRGATTPSTLQEGRTTAMAATRFTHDAFLYSSDDELVGGLSTYVHGGLAAGDAVIAVLPERNATLLRDRLGPAAGEVEFIDAVGWYRRPSATIAGYDRVLDALGEKRGRVIGEVQFGGDPVRWSDWTRYEAALNEAFQGRNAHLVCPYDTRILPLRVVEDACRTHPALWTGADRQVSESFTDPRRVAHEVARPFGAPGAAPDLEIWVDTEPHGARRAFTKAARAGGLDRETVANLALAVNEVVTNALLHGGGSAQLRVWQQPPAGIVCAVSDSGPGVDDPLVGFVPPSLTATGGRGVWMARQLFDRVELESGPDGFTVWLASDPATDGPA